MDLWYIVWADWSISDYIVLTYSNLSGWPIWYTWWDCIGQYDQTIHFECIGQYNDTTMIPCWPMGALYCIGRSTYDDTVSARHCVGRYIHPWRFYSIGRSWYDDIVSANVSISIVSADIICTQRLYSIGRSWYNDIVSANVSIALSRLI